MDPTTTRVVGLNPQTNMVFTVVKPVMGILQVSPQQQSYSTNPPPVSSHSMELQQNSLMLSSPPQVLAHNMGAPLPTQVQMGQEPVEIQDSGEHTDSLGVGAVNSGEGSSRVEHMPFAEVSSLLDPNMKGSKARKYLISYDEIRRRLQPPEKMSLRSIAAYTRVSRGPASKKTLLESLNVLGLSPSTTTSVSSSFSKLTEGDTRALCEDMKDFSHDYIDYESLAKQLIPKTNTVQHWSKIIETKNHLEDIRACFQEPCHSQAFDNVTHGLGVGMLDVVLDMISSVIQYQVRILSGSAAADATSGHTSTLSMPRRQRVRRRHRKFTANETTARDSILALKEGKTKGKSRGRGRKKAKQDGGPVESQGECSKVMEQNVASDVLTLVSVGYEAVSNDVNTNLEVVDTVIG